jgi:gliding motility-associated-like protein
MVRRFKYLVFLLCITGSYLLRAHEHPAVKPSLIRFTENKNQWDGFIKYRAQLDGGALFLQNNRLTYHFYDKDTYRSIHGNPKTKVKDIKRVWFHVNFLNPNPDVSYTSVTPAPDYNNYFIGKDPAKWAANVKNYSEVMYQNIWPGIDLQMIGQDNSMKSNFYVAPGTDASAIQLNYEGVKNISLKNNVLSISTIINEMTEHEPYAYQVINGTKKEVPCNFKLKKNTLSYEFPEGYDKSLELVIDPVLVFACSSGSTADNFGMTATYDEEGNLYSGGTAFDIGFPVTAGAYDPNYSSLVQYGQTDVVITKYDSSGTFLRYSTYLGGADDADVVNSLIVDAQDNLYMYGVTASPDFPTSASAYDQTFNGGQRVRYYYNGAFFEHGTDIYISKLNSTGTALLSSTFIGGSSNDGLNYTVDSTFQGSIFPYGNIYQPNYDSLLFNYGDQNRGEIQLDNAGNVVVASTTRSADFPVNGFDNSLGGVQDAIVFKLTSNLDALTWSTFFGGSSLDAGHALCLDANNNVFFTGGSCSQDLDITAGAFSPTYGGGKADGYIAKIKNDGTALLHSTYIGTTNYDQCYFVQLDNSANVFVFGQTQGTMAVVNAAYSNTNGRQFISKLDSTMGTLLMQTKFGNGNPTINISPSAFLVDCAENIYLSGWGGNIITGPATFNMPLTANAHQPSTDGFNFYLMVLSKNAGSLLYATYFGGGSSREHVDGGTSRFDKKGIIYQSVCAGCNGYDDFPVTSGSWPTSLYGNNWNQSSNCNNGTFKFNFEYAIPVAQMTSNIVSGCSPLTVNFTNTSISAVQYLWDFGSNDTTSLILNPVKTFTTPGTYTVVLLAKNSACFNVWDTAYTVITVFPKPDGLATATLQPCTNTWDFASQSTVSSGTLSYAWDFGDSGTASTPTITHPYASAGSYTTQLIVTSDHGCKDTVLLPVQTTLHPDSVSGGASFCENGINPVPLTATGGGTYVWNPATGLSNAAIANPIATVTASVTYTVTISENDAAGNPCPSDQTVSIIVYPVPDAQATVSIQPCTNTFDFTNLSTISSGTMTYAWDFDDATNSVVTSPTHTYAGNGSYTVSLHVTSDHGCTDSVFLPVQTILTPDSANGDAAYCANVVTPTSLNASGGTSYSWSPAAGLSNPAIASPVASPAVSTTYTVTISENDFGGNVCTSTHTVGIIVHPAPDAQATVTIQPCSSTFDFNNLSTISAGILSYDWDFGDNTNSALTSPTHSYTTNGSYTVSLHVTSDQGCVDSVFLPVQTLLTPDVANGGGAYCGDSIVPIQLTASGGTSYSWLPVAGLNNPSIANPVAMPGSTTSYTVTISETDFGGNVCASTHTIDITVYPTVSANYTYTSNACGNTFNFTNTSLGAVNSWSWNFGDSYSSVSEDPNHSYTTPGTYSVSLAVQNSFGCTDTIIKPLTLAGFNPLNISAAQTICFNQSAQLNASGGIAYSWSPAASLNSSSIPNPTASPSVTTTYSVVVTTLSSLGATCYSNLVTTVNVSTLGGTLLTTSANPDTLYEGESSQINSNISAPFTIHWSPPYALSSTTVYDPIATPLHTTTYTAIATDNHGCQYPLDTLTIYVLSRQCDEGSVFIPNTFSPNSDGSNDILYIRSNFVADLYFAVYDRWGERVFETTDIAKGWDGIFKGMKSDPGVFGYYLKYTCTNGQESFKKGNVTLIR